MKTLKMAWLTAALWFLGILARDCVVNAKNSTCPHQGDSVIDCHYKKLFHRFNCGRNYSLKGDYLNGLRREKHKLVKLDLNGGCNRFSLSNGFHLNQDISDDSYRWNASISSSRSTGNASFLLVSAQKREKPKHITPIRDSTLLTLGYVSHFLSFNFLRPENGDKRSTTSRRPGTELVPEENGVHNVEVVFNVTDDREIDKFALKGHQISRSTIKLVCVQYVNGTRQEDGCNSTKTSNLTVTCSCEINSDNGQTHIGVKTEFMSLAGSESVMPTYFALTLLSTLFLLLTLISLIRFRRVYKDTHKRLVVQINLTVSLLLRHTFLLTGFGISVFNPLDRKACQLMAVCHVYFLITTVLWVLVEGVIVYRKVCKSSLSISVRSIVEITLVVWLLPFILVASISAYEVANDHYIKSAESYGLIKERVQSISSDENFLHFEMSKFRKYDFCWSTSQIVTLAIGVPVTLSLCVNTVILIWVGVVVWKIRSADRINTPAAVRKEVHTRSQTISTFRAVVILTAVLGIPWLLSLLFNLIEGIEKMTSLVPSYIHFVCVFLQGPALFYIYCVQKKELRVAIRRDIVSNNVKHSLGSKRSQQGLNSSSRQHEND